MSGIPSLTILSEEQKFNGENLLQWNTNITQLLGSKGLVGYINGNIPKPQSTTTPSTSETTADKSLQTTTTTPIYSTTPTLDEWVFRDQLARGHVTLNCTDVSSLGVVTTGTAKEAWDSIQTEWGKSTDMRRSHAQEALNRTTYTEGTDIREHIKLLRVRKTAVDNLTDSKMTDETWRGILIRSIPPTSKWLPVIPSLYALTTSADVISILFAHGMILDSYKPANNSNTALAATTKDGCTNPNCKAKKRTTHTTANCYWPGGGKEGQFPPNFGQRSKANAANTTNSTTNPPTNSTNPTTQQPGDHFALSASVPDTPGRSGVLINDNDDPITTPSKALISKAFLSFKQGEVPTFMDSGASDTMFVSRKSFSDYKPLDSRVGDSAKAVDGGFEIVGEGSVVQKYRVDGKDKTITYTKALHTPTLNANLISVGALDNAGLITTFGQGKGITRTTDGTVVLSGTNVNGMYLLDPMETKPTSIAMKSSLVTTSLEQWHRRFAHCSPSMIKEMAKKNLVDGLQISEDALTGQCEDCILGRQTRRPFDGVTEKDIPPLDLVSFDLWGPSRVKSIGGKIFFMVIVDAGTSCKFGAYLPDKSDASTIEAFDEFRTKAETMTGRKIRRIRTDGAFDSAAWKEYLKKHGIIHEPTAPYSSAQNGLAERAIRTTMEDVRTLLNDSNLGHSYWAEGAAYSIETRNLIPSSRNPGKIPLESFTGKRQTVSHLRVFGAKCWAKIPTVHGVQVTGGSKLDPRSVECRLLGYSSGHGNYKVQDCSTNCVFVSRDVIFEEGLPHRTSANVGEQIELFDTLIETSADMTKNSQPDPDMAIDSSDPDLDRDEPGHHARDPDNQSARNIAPTNDEPRRSARTHQPSQAGLQSGEYKQRETAGKGEGEDWATNRKNPRANSAIDSFPADRENMEACLNETKASHNIPHSYKHAMATDPERWMIPMKAEMETLKSKHTWDLVRPPMGSNIMGSMWVYDIKWDGEGNRIKDKARLVAKGYTQQLGVDYNETWAGVTRLESVRMTAAIAARLNLKLWRIDFVGAYLNSLTKEDIYMMQPEGFIEPGFEDRVAKLIHTIYGTMQGGHDWWETLDVTYDNLDYTKSRADPCVRYKKEEDNYTLTDTYNDDVFGASNNDEEIQKRKDEMAKIWDIKDVGETEYFLGMRVQQDLEKGIIRLTQRPYWQQVLSRYQLENVIPRNTPLPVGITLDNEMSPKTDSEKKEMKDKPYRSLLGSIMWGQLATRPDLSFSVSLLARFQSDPGLSHWSALIHVVGYIKNTIDYGLTYSREFDLSPNAYADADYGGCKETRRSTSGYVFTMAGGAVSWSSKRQATVALSTVEAEYVAMSRCAQQMVWMNSWLDEVKIEHTLPGLIRGDNRGAIALTKNTKDHGKVKHIDIRHHYIRDLVKSGEIIIEQVPSEENLADLFTKPLPRDQHHRLLNALNIK
jgi:Reverse transcriptase (RNA-dependent DNA polymerase)/GAG-pre-integrase domain/gag-polypeptide of LTR copia-type